MFILEDGGLSSERIGGEEEREGGGTGGKGISSGQLCGSNPGNPLNPSEESQSLKKKSESGIYISRKKISLHLKSLSNHGLCYCCLCF